MISNTCVVVDLDGLRKQLSRKGPSFVVWELLQNALDAEGSTKVDVILEPIPGRPAVKLVVEDNSPIGFKDLSHAWTLFAPSEKAGNPEKRGFMNLGEKLALSMCETASIRTTSGGVRFDVDGRHTLRGRRPFGTSVEMVLRITHRQCQEILDEVRNLAIPPCGVTLEVNGERVTGPGRLRYYDQELPTRVADDDGFLRQTRRATVVEVYEMPPVVHAWLYEMGIPVVPIDTPWSVNVGQKVLLGADRDNVTPGYLREIHVGLLNHMADKLARDEVASDWVAGALESPKMEQQAIMAVLDTQYGKKRVVVDPSDPEATKRAVEEGYTVIQPGSHTGAVWENFRHHEAVLPAGRVTPTPKPFTPDGAPIKTIPGDDYTPDQRKRVAFILRFGERLLGHQIRVELACQFGWGFEAAYGNSTITINALRLRDAWFHHENYHCSVIDLLIHEFAHDLCSDHLAKEYHKACTQLAGKAVELAVTDPDLFE